MVYFDIIPSIIKYATGSTNETFWAWPYREERLESGDSNDLNILKRIEMLLLFPDGVVAIKTNRSC